MEAVGGFKKLKTACVPQTFASKINEGVGDSVRALGRVASKQQSYPLSNFYPFSLQTKENHRQSICGGNLPQHVPSVHTHAETLNVVTRQ